MLSLNTQFRFTFLGISLVPIFGIQHLSYPSSIFAIVYRIVHMLPYFRWTGTHIPWHRLSIRICSSVISADLWTISLRSRYVYSVFVQYRISLTR